MQRAHSAKVNLHHNHGGTSVNQSMWLKQYQWKKLKSFFTLVIKNLLAIYV